MDEADVMAELLFNHKRSIRLIKRSELEIHLR